MASCTVLAVFCVLWATTLAQSQNRQPRFINAEEVIAYFQSGIRENLNITNRPVITLTCSDADGDIIQYSASRTSSVRIDAVTGQIYFTRPLDYEQSVNSNNQNEKANSVTFECQDYNDQFIPISEPAVLAITITVIDENDNYPQFSVQSADGYTLPIREDAPVGTTLLPLLSVFDADQGLNARLDSVRFQCGNTQEEQEGCRIFNVNFTRVEEQRYTVSIVTREPLDYEKRTFYKLSLEAVDGLGTPEVPHLTSSVGVRIVVEDSQDTDPRFSNQNFNFDIFEGLAVGSPVSFNLSARDGDSGAQRPIKLEILDDDHNLFRPGESYLINNERGIYTAQLFVRSEIDRESEGLFGGTYTFIAKATELMDDGTLTSATVTTQFTARILDINDNGPQFLRSSDNVRVTEMDGMSGIVQIPNLRIDVTDPDEPSNARFRVDIVQQSAAGAFGLTPEGITTGSASFYLTVNNFQRFDYDKPEFRTQTVVLRAIEILPNNELGTKSSSATVTVVLMDSNDNPPVFSSPSYIGSVRENANNGTFILEIEASDKDSGEYGTLVYSIAARVRDKFYIDSGTGVISLIGALDYEQQNTYSFLVFAADTSSKPLTSQVPVQISVLDYNDIGPQFVPPTYTAVVPENSLTFESPVVVGAIDPADPDATITYRIVGGNTPTNSFVMNPTTGELTLQSPLDFEQSPNGTYSLDVEASDNGEPPLTARTKITVTVLDENDFVPVFNRTLYTATISEAIAPGTSLLTVTATDGDAGSNGVITYRIGAGTRDNFFVDNSGVLSISNSPSFDYDAYPSYSFTVIATDGGSPQQSATASVSIIVTDANNKPPSFDRILYNQVIPEATAVGTSVLRVSATDPDTRNRLQYSIDRPSITAINQAGAQVGSTYPFDFRELFEIGQSDGIIRVKSALNRDYVVEVAFIVKVQDVHETAIGEQTATSRVTITISGTPNTELYFNPPWTKENPVYEYSILESARVGVEIMTLQARDPTVGGAIVPNYREVSEPNLEDYFTVGQTTGTVYLNKALDYEEGGLVHSVVVRAFSNDGRSATATVRILVQDDNDEVPKFTQSLYQFRVTENAKRPYSVGVISAFDADSSTYGPIRYRLEGRDSTDFFIFDNGYGTSAEILVADKLDFETRPRYDLDVFAVDNANVLGVQNTGRAQVEIYVIDENDNTPKFDDTNRTFSVAETAPIGTRLGQALARDGDFGLNGRIDYKLVQEPNSGTAGLSALRLFNVTSSTAIVVTQASLRGLSGIYTMRLVATDRGSPPRSSSILVTVKVQGAEDDDGTPKWLLPINNDVVEVPENTSNIPVPVAVQAIPRTPNASALYSFSIFQNDWRYFSIDRYTGNINLTTKLDRELQENYTLVIVATDSANSTLFSRRTLIVRLKDINDNIPSFKRNYAACPSDLDVPVKISADDNTPNDTIVARAIACDPDAPENSEMYYELYTGNAICAEEHSGAFRVDRNGSIITEQMLDYEDRTEYLVCVEVKPVKPLDTPVQRKKRSFDPRRMIPNDTVAYFEIRIRDINDKGPVFPNDTVVAVLQETPSSSSVVQVTATDSDGPQHNRVIYRIAETMYYPADGGPPYTLDTAFAINPNTGLVSTNLPSYEDFVNGYFLLKIFAQDYETAALNDTMTLKIIVHKRSQILRVVLDQTPANGRAKAEDLIKDLNGVNEDIQFYFLTASEHRTLNLPMDTRTDVCFVVVSNNRAYDANGGIGVLDRASYRDVLGDADYKFVDRGACYPMRSSAQNVKWQDLWWVLVAIAIFIFICCLILLATIHILYDRYKSYMNTHRTYMVPQ